VNQLILVKMSKYSMKQSSISGLLLCTLLTILASCTSHQQTLLFLGDSMTAGDGVDAGNAFPALVGQQIKDIRTINQGRSGWSTDTFLDKWDEVEEDFPARADFVFIQLGANDLRVLGHQDSTITICIENMQEILRRLRKNYPDAEIVLMSSPKLDPAAMNEQIRQAGFGASTNEYLSRIGEGYSMIAADNAYNFVDLHRLVPINNTLDGAHLDEGGHKIVANIIIRFLRALMQSKQLSNHENQN
jgi:lysophospholipase L1-like esterase